MLYLMMLALSCDNVVFDDLYVCIVFKLLL